jgi:hypothetical protein
MRESLKMRGEYAASSPRCLYRTPSIDYHKWQTQNAMTTRIQVITGGSERRQVGERASQAHWRKNIGVHVFVNQRSILKQIIRAALTSGRFWRWNHTEQRPRYPATIGTFQKSNILISIKFRKHLRDGDKRTTASHCYTCVHHSTIPKLLYT